MRISLRNDINDDIVRFSHEVIKAPNITYYNRRGRYKDACLYLNPSKDIVATKYYKHYYFDKSRENYHYMWLNHIIYYDITLSWQHYRYQYTSKVLHDILGYNSYIDIDCYGSLILILRRPTIRDNINNFYDNITNYKMGNPSDDNALNEQKIMIIKQVNENTNKEHFITLNLAQYDGIRISTYKCHIFLIYTSMNNNNNNNINNNNSTNKCQRAIDNCDWH